MVIMCFDEIAVQFRTRIHLRKMLKSLWCSLWDIYVFLSIKTNLHIFRKPLFLDIFLLCLRKNAIFVPVKPLFFRAVFRKSARFRNAMRHLRNFESDEVLENECLTKNNASKVHHLTMIYWYICENFRPFDVIACLAGFYRGIYMEPEVETIEQTTDSQSVSKVFH